MLNGVALRFYWPVNPFKWKCGREELRDYQRAMVKCKKYECAGDQTSRGGGGRQCACNIALKRVRLTVIAMEKQ